jgi:hypothetical protein
MIFFAKVAFLLAIAPLLLEYQGNRTKIIYSKKALSLPA